jgi:hypothetical protein
MYCHTSQKMKECDTEGRVLCMEFDRDFLVSESEIDELFSCLYYSSIFLF